MKQKDKLIIDIGYDRELLDMLPPYYRDFLESQQYLESSDVEFTRLYGELSDVARQGFVRYATWALDLWEDVLGIPVNPELSVDERRGRILAKIRGHGTSTPEMIKNVAESYYSGEVDVIEVNGEYRLILKFISSIGTPTNIDIVKESVEAIIPAHIALEFMYRYLRIKEIHKVKKIKEMEKLKLDQFAGDELRN